MKKPKQVKTLVQLKKLANERRSVYGFHNIVSHPKPAAWVLNLQGVVLARMIESGMFVYVPKTNNKSPFAKRVSMIQRNPEK